MLLRWYSQSFLTALESKENTLKEEKHNLETLSIHLLDPGLLSRSNWNMTRELFPFLFSWKKLETSTRQTTRGNKGDQTPHLAGKGSTIRPPGQYPGSIWWESYTVHNKSKAEAPGKKAFVPMISRIFIFICNGWLTLQPSSGLGRLSGWPSRLNAQRSWVQTIMKTQNSSQLIKILL